MNFGKCVYLYNYHPSYIEEIEHIRTLGIFMSQESFCLLLNLI